MGSGGILSIVFLIGALVLALSAFRGRRMPAGKMLRLALIWGVIIVALVLVLKAVGY